MDENTQTQDVNIQADTTTATDSSPVDQTSSEQGTEVTQDSSAVTSTDETKTVPYERFKEVNENYRKTEQQLQQMQDRIAQFELRTSTQPQTPTQPVDPMVQQAKEQLKSLLQEVAPELGFVSKQELEIQKRNEAVRNEVERLSNKYSGKDGLPKFDEKVVIKHAIDNGINNLEVAYKMMNEDAIMNQKIQQAIAKSRGIQTESSNSTGSNNVGVTNDDLMKAAMQGDREAQLLFNKRILAGLKREK